MFEIKIPRILFLALDIASFYRSSFFNTNDLVILSNRYKSDLVRSKKYKKDYKYLDDTRFGGLRGNFSTLLTWRGLVKRGSTIVSSYSLGRDNRLLNAVCNGSIILDREKFTAYTKDKKLMNLLETETWLRNVRETQAHVKIMLSKNVDIPLQRDNIKFPKESVFKSKNGQYFIRGLVNNFIDSSNNILEFSIINLWRGKKFRKENLHLLIILPSPKNPLDRIYIIKNEDLYIRKPIFLYVDLSKNICKDKDNYIYKLYPLAEGIEKFSKENDNIEKRLNYKWQELKEKYCKEEVDFEFRKEDEFSNFLKLFLKWNRIFSIDGKDVIDVRVISSGGPDVELVFSGGTIQKLELEHRWNNYLDHNHHINNAFKNVWIFAEEKFDLEKILTLFKELKKENNERIPDVFLSIDESENRTAFRIDWINKKAEKLDLDF